MTFNFTDGNPPFADDDFARLLDAMDASTDGIGEAAFDGGFENETPHPASWLLRYLKAAQNVLRTFEVLQKQCPGELAVLMQYYQNTLAPGYFLPPNLAPLDDVERKALETVLSTANRTSGSALAGFIVAVAAHVAIGPSASSSLLMGNATLGGSAPTNPLEGLVFGLYKAISLQVEVMVSSSEALNKHTFLGDWAENGNDAQQLFAHAATFIGSLALSEVAGILISPFAVVSGVAIGTLGLAASTLLQNPDVQKLAAFMVGQQAELSRTVKPEAAEAYIARQMYYADAVAALHAYQSGEGNYCKEDIQRIGKYVNTLKQRDENRLLAEEKAYLATVEELGIMEHIIALYHAAPVTRPNQEKQGGRG